MRKFTLLIFAVFFFSCTHPVKFDYEANFESLVKYSCGYNITNTNSNTVVLILQNEDCICTEQDVALSKSLLESEKYKLYHFVIILSSRNHKFLKDIPSSDAKRVSLIINSNNLLINHGYVAVTDQVMIYHTGHPSYFADMHVIKPDKIKPQIL